MINIREERLEDIPEIRKLNQAAFGGDTEADIVDVLRNDPACALSLVAEQDGRIVGHIMFSRVEIEPGESKNDILGLAPMAVLPAFQKKGIGSQLVEAGLQRCVSKGCPAVVVIGHPEFYRRFGFIPAEKYDIKSEFDVPSEVFMIKELAEDALKGLRGAARYHKAFSNL